MTHLERLRGELRAIDCQGLLIPSTDEYLSEFAHPFAQRLGWATGFSGSTGLAAVLLDRAALFLDGRYQLQGKRETAGLDIEVLDASEASRRSWLSAHLIPGQRLALDARLHSYPEVERMLEFASKRGIDALDLPFNPIDKLWSAGRLPRSSSAVIDYPAYFAGEDALAKCARLQARLQDTGADYHLLADPEDVAWLLNVRSCESLEPTSTGWHILPIPLSRALVDAAGRVFWFIESSRLAPEVTAQLAGLATIIDPEHFEAFLEQRVCAKVVSTNLRRTPHRFAATIARLGALRDDCVVARQRWIKHPIEIERAREGHYRDSQAVIRFLSWLQRTVQERPVTEIAASRQLREFRREIPQYLGISMPLMSASGVSGSMPHYVPTAQSNRTLNDHPIYWMDSGGQYHGCTTDNTVCIAVREPEPKHVRAHTLVVKAFIGLARARFPAGTSSAQVDVLARQHLWQHGIDYDHGTGHGVGNYMNVHEGPYMRKEFDHPMVAPIEAGMIVSNEPAYYSDGDFGVRIESHLVAVESRHEGFLEFETLSRLPIDPHLLDDSMLTADEIAWLAEYHIGIRDGYTGCFDEATRDWLRKIVDTYVAKANRL